MFLLRSGNLQINGSLLLVKYKEMAQKDPEIELALLCTTVFCKKERAQRIFSYMFFICMRDVTMYVLHLNENCARNVC